MLKVVNIRKVIKERIKENREVFLKYKVIPHVDFSIGVFKNNEVTYHAPYGMTCRFDNNDNIEHLESIHIHVHTIFNLSKILKKNHIDLTNEIMDELIENLESRVFTRKILVRS